MKNEKISSRIDADTSKPETEVGAGGRADDEPDYLALQLEDVAKFADGRPVKLVMTGGPRNRLLSATLDDGTECSMKVEGLAEELERALEELHDLRSRLRWVETPAEGVWFWQGRGDEPASLVCPVVMEAETLRALLKAGPTPTSETTSPPSEPEGVKFKKISSHVDDRIPEPDASLEPGAGAPAVDEQIDRALWEQYGRHLNARRLPKSREILTKLVVAERERVLKVLADELEERAFQVIGSGPCVKMSTVAFISRLLLGGQR